MSTDDITYLKPGDTTTSRASAPHGLLGTLTWCLTADGGADLITATTTATTEPKIGNYAATVTIPDDAPTSRTQTYSVYWNDGTQIVRDDALTIVIVAETPSPAPSTEGHYTSPDAVRDQLGVDDTALTDDDALILIADTEDAVIDPLLGAWPIDTTTGRKIIEADVEPWQWTKLSRATTLAAANLYTVGPDAIGGPQWRRERGPDFEVEDPTGASRVATAQVLNILDASQLRRLTGRATAGSRMRPRERRFRTAP